MWGHDQSFSNHSIITGLGQAINNSNKVRRMISVVKVEIEIRIIVKVSQM